MLMSAFICWTASAQEEEGALDPGFSTASLTDHGTPATVHDLVHQEFGRLVVVGEFDAVGAASTGRIVRFLPDGSVDPAFDSGSGANGPIRCVIVVDRQKLLIGGDFTEFNGVSRSRIARLHPDGSLDTSFDPGTGFNGSVYSLTTGYLDSSSYCVGGSFSEFDGEGRTNLSMIDHTGALVDDFTTQTNGTVHVVYSSRSLPGRSNSYVIGGEFTEAGGQPRNRFAGLRADGSLSDLNANPADGPDGPVLAVAEGNRDELFVGGGFSLWDGESRENLALLVGSTSVGLSPDPAPAVDGEVRTLKGDGTGLMMLGGDFASVDHEPRSNFAGLARAGRFDGEWELDASFDGGADGPIEAVSHSAEEKVVIGGSFGEAGKSPRAAVARLLGPRGLDPPPQPAGVLAEAISSDGAVALWERRSNVLGYRIEIRGETIDNWETFEEAPYGPSSVLAGLTTGSHYQLRVVTLGSNGDSAPSETTSFRTDAIPWEGPGSPDPTVPAVNSGVLDTAVLRPDHSIIATGSFFSPDDPSGLVRYLQSGTKDLSFDVGTISPLSSGGTLAASADGSVYLGGRFTEVGGIDLDSIARVDPHGRVDPDFVPHPGLIDEPHALGIQRDGKLLVAETFPSGSDPSIIRLFPSGAPDDSFDARSDRVEGLRVLPDDRLLVWGSSMTLGGEEAMDVAVTSPDGSIDPSFTPFDSAENVNDVIPLSGDRWLVVADEELVRLLPDGTPDDSFEFDETPDSHLFPNALFRTAIEQPDGKVLVVGGFDSIGDRILPGIARFAPDGSFDENFRPGSGFLGRIVTGGNIRPAVPREILLLPDQRIVVAGQFDTYNRANHKALAFITGDAAPAEPPDPPEPLVSPAGDGATEIRWEAAPGAFDYRIESSPDGLTDWTPCSIEGHATTRVVLPFHGPAPVYYRVVARNAEGTAESSVVEASTNDSYEEWKLGFDLASNAADDSDNDADGRRLIMEYAMGTDPTATDHSPWPRFFQDNDEIGIAFPELRDDLEIEMEAARTLDDWSSEVVTEVRDGELIGTVPKVPGNQHFLRATVRLSDE